jgi:dTDP-4-amino-4,6-dideoxygalactose transaminase
LLRDAVSARAAVAAAGHCPRTEALMARTLMLSITPDYTDQDARDVVAAVAKVTRALA